MIGADDDAGRPFTADKLVRTMLADVVERVDHPVAPFDTKQAFIRDLERKVVTYIFQLARVAFFEKRLLDHLETYREGADATVTALSSTWGHYR